MKGLYNVVAGVRKGMNGVVTDDDIWRQDLEVGLWFTFHQQLGFQMYPNIYYFLCHKSHIQGLVYIAGNRKKSLNGSDIDSYIHQRFCILHLKFVSCD